MVRFSWTKNNEADISAYEVWRKINTGSWQLISTTSNNYFVDPTYYYAPGAGDFMVTYKVRAKDVGNYFSAYSSEVSTRAEELGKQKVVNNLELDYGLLQNYPNPFNPSTKISYSIKEEGLVILKVYDVLGKEIVTLVNESKPAGVYEAEFNASQLPSGMYIYKIQAGSFSDVKKMILTK
ncbi:MAG: T9SS type A sorting domain-containing protein [Ignavibacteriales bacterium]|nr:T9SS type A sorting domain-containing protein [Ignavibacteriales bacterium]